MKSQSNPCVTQKQTKNSHSCKTNYIKLKLENRKHLGNRSSAPESLSWWNIQLWRVGVTEVKVGPRLGDWSRAGLRGGEGWLPPPADTAAFTSYFWPHEQGKEKTTQNSEASLQGGMLKALHIHSHSGYLDMYTQVLKHTSQTHNSYTQALI